MTICRSASDGAVPFRLASITRRQASTVTSSPRSLAASSTFQAASRDLSGFGSSETSACSQATAPNETALMVISPPISYRLSLGNTRGLARDVGTGGRGILAGLIEFHDAAGCRDVEVTELVFQVLQVVRGDAVIPGAEKKQRHARIPRKVEGFGQNQQ